MIKMSIIPKRLYGQKSSLQCYIGRYKQLNYCPSWLVNSRNYSSSNRAWKYSSSSSIIKANDDQINPQNSTNQSNKRLPGAYFNKQRNHWMSRIMVRGKLLYLGSFSTAEEAHEAYMAAKSFFDPETAAKLQGRIRRVKKYKGVMYDSETGCFEAVLLHENKEISGGVYSTAEEAARAYDALARMYQGSGAETNFDVDTLAGWVPPTQETRAVKIPVLKNTALNVDEITNALEAERGIDVLKIDLRGRFSLAEWLVLVTGRSVSHMRRMGDMIVKALHDRELQPSHEVGEWCVEGRDMDDWMVVDCGNIVVCIFDTEARECFALEQLYGKDQEDDANANFEEIEMNHSDTKKRQKSVEIDDDEEAFNRWLDENPIPEKWLNRLDRDAEDVAAKKRIQKFQSR